MPMLCWNAEKKLAAPENHTETLTGPEAVAPTVMGLPRFAHVTYVAYVAVIQMGGHQGVNVYE